MAHEIFISLTHHDAPIADALRAALGALLGETVIVHYSTSKELEGGIRHGEDWFQWIVARVRECDFALILLTPASAQKPWILWEAGAVHGAALAAGNEGLRKIRPLVYQLNADQIPSPIRDSKVQFLYGDQKKDMFAFYKEIVQQYGEQMGLDRYGRARENLAGIVDDYLAAVTKFLRTAPALPTSTMVEEWRKRLDQLLAESRASEIDYLREWIDIAFGRDNEEGEHPLDVQLHLRLAEGYTRAKRSEQAIRQLELAQRLAPRDIYLLRRLGKAYLDAQQPEKAGELIERIQPGFLKGHHGRRESEAARGPGAVSRACARCQGGRLGSAEPWKRQAGKGTAVCQRRSPFNGCDVEVRRVSAA
jgi:tetratricopeptide (TPR) repeat protein